MKLRYPVVALTYRYLEGFEVVNPRADMGVRLMQKSTDSVLNDVILSRSSLNMQLTAHITTCHRIDKWSCYQYV